MEGDRPHEPRREPDHSSEPRHERDQHGARPSEPARHADEKERASEWETAQRKRRNGFIVRLVLGLTLLILFVIFVTQNSRSVDVNFLWLETKTPLVLVFVICALIGGLVAYLLGRSGRRASRKYIKELERRLDGHGNKRD